MTDKKKTNGQNETELFALAKEAADKVEFKTGEIKLRKNHINLRRGKKRKPNSEASIRYKTITSLRYGEPETMKHGFLTVVTQDGKGTGIEDIKTAKEDRQTVTFSKKDSEAILLFAHAFNAYMQKVNDDYTTLTIIDPKEIKRIDKEEEERIKAKLDDYKKNGIVFCPKCYSLRQAQLHPVLSKEANRGGPKDFYMCKDCGHRWHTKKAAKKDY